MIAINERYRQFLKSLYDNEDVINEIEDEPSQYTNQFISEYLEMQQQFIEQLRIYIPQYDELCHKHHLNPDRIHILELFNENNIILFITAGKEYFEVFQESQQLISVMELPYIDPFTQQHLYLWTIHI